MDDKEIEIGGCITVPKNVSTDAVIDAFINWVEANGWRFGGGFQEIVDGYYVDCKGNPVVPIDREEKSL